MTIQKTYGQVSWEATHDLHDDDWHELDNADKVTLETQAWAVIEEFLRRTHQFEIDHLKNIIAMLQEELAILAGKCP